MGFKLFAAQPVGLHGGVGKVNMLGFTARLCPTFSLIRLDVDILAFSRAKEWLQEKCSIGSCRLGVFMGG